MLIVDNDEIVRMLLQEICAEYGWNVVVAATTDDAILAAGLQQSISTYWTVLDG